MSSGGNSTSGRVAAAIVNHGTPDLTRMAVWSLRGHYPDLPITVVESGSADDSAERLRALADEVRPFTLVECAHNVHHGPGLDLAIRAMDAEWALVFDSDCILYRPGLLEAMLALPAAPGAYMIGDVVTIDAMGYRPDGGAQETWAYVHPRCALVRRATYERLPPFEKHGVPCLANEKAAAAQGHPLVHFPVDAYVYHFGRGTAARHGYRLGWKGRLWELRHRLRRLGRAVAGRR